MNPQKTTKQKQACACKQQQAHHASTKRCLYKKTHLDTPDNATRCVRSPQRRGVSASARRSAFAVFRPSPGTGHRNDVARKAGPRRRARLTAAVRRSTSSSGAGGRDGT